MLQCTAGKKAVVLAFRTAKYFEQLTGSGTTEEIFGAGPDHMEGIGGRLHLKGGRLVT